MYEILIVKNNKKPELFMNYTNLSKAEAEQIKKDWETNIFTADVYFDPVPYLKIQKIRD